MSEEVKFPPGGETIKEKLPSGEILEKVIIRSYPKVIVMTWVLGVISLIFGFIESLYPYTDYPNIHKALGLFFVGLFFFIVLVDAFEFTEMKTFLLMALIVIVVLLYLLLTQAGIMPTVSGMEHIYDAVNIVISAHAYLAIGVLLIIALILIVLSRMFDYWIIEPNQVTHKTGIFGRVERYPTSGLQYSIDITDIFEYLLFFRSGTLKLYFPAEKKVITLSVVPNIKSIEEKIRKLLGFIEVE